MNKTLLVAGALALVAGCAEVNYVPTQKSPRALAARPKDEIEIFTTSKPDKAYAEVGIFTAEAFRQNHGGSPLVRNSELIEMVREKAGGVGCDGVILTPAGESSYQGTCIVYK